MRSIIIAAALALGTLGFLSASPAEAGPRGGGRAVGHRSGYSGGRSYQGYRNGGYGYRGYYGNSYRSYYGVRPYSAYGYYQPVPLLPVLPPVPLALPGYGNGYYQPGFGY